MNLDYLLNNLLTSGRGLSTSETLCKLRILNTFHVAVIMTAPVLGLFYFYVGALVLFYVTILAGLLMIVSFLLLRKTKSLSLGGPFTTSLGNFLQPKYYEHSRPALAYLQGKAREGDVLYVTYGATPAFRFYAPGYGLDTMRVEFGEREGYENPQVILQ